MSILDERSEGPAMVVVDGVAMTAARWHVWDSEDRDEITEEDRDRDEEMGS